MENFGRGLLDVIFHLCYGIEIEDGRPTPMENIQLVENMAKDMLLLPDECKISIAQDIGKKMLWDAAAYGLSNLVRLMLKLGMGADDRKGSTTPLCRAMYARFDNTAVVDVLLSHKADPNFKGANGNTLLGIIAARSHFADFLPIARRLVEHGASIHHRCDHGDSILHYAVQPICKEKEREGELDMNLVEYYLSLGADLFVRNNSGKRASDIAVGECKRILKNHEEFIKMQNPARYMPQSVDSKLLTDLSVVFHNHCLSPAGGDLFPLIAAFLLPPAQQLRYQTTRSLMASK